MFENELLEHILREQRATVGILLHISHQLARLVEEENPHYPTGFTIQQESIMALVAVAPGNSPVYTATPTPAGTAPGAGLIPTWTSSDTVNAPVTADATGLVGTVAIPATAVVGTTFTLAVSLTNADGTVATGTLDQTIVAPASPDVTGFTIAQTA